MGQKNLKVKNHKTSSKVTITGIIKFTGIILWKNCDFMEFFSEIYVCRGTYVLNNFALCITYTYT